MARRDWLATTAKGTTMLFRGSAPALVTPFKNGSIDKDAFKRLLDFQLREGSDALVVCGTTGEPSTMSLAEHRELVDIAVKHVAGDVPIIAGSGGNNTQGVIAAAQAFEALGVDGLLAVTPYYNRTTQGGLLAHYRAIADSVSLPIIVYNVPSRTGMNIEPETLAELGRDPRFCGVKEASGNLCQIMEYFHVRPGTMSVFSGNDDQVYPFLAMGGEGVISVVANILPRQMHQMTTAYFEGDTEGALALQLELLPLIKALFSEVSPIPVKAALSMMGMIEDELRLPLVPLSQPNREVLREQLTEVGLL